mmetsp:Transcript_10687/g.19354  ORF Transcript_10687/g.19354 Transcript_10687/m.19354 type:complete len:278 (-) Transcript_10687:138-971(-)
MAPLPDEALFRDTDVLWRPCPTTTSFTTEDDTQSLPLNSTAPCVRFHSELFEGWAQLWVAGLPAEEPSRDKRRLEGRLTLFTVSGRFKQETPVSDIYTGQEYSRALTNVPGAWVVNSAIAAVKMLSPTSNFGDTNDPFVLTPLLSGAHMMSVSAQPAEPDALPFEDCSAWGEEFVDAGTGTPLGPDARRKNYACSPHARSATFDTTHYHTFHFFQNIIDLSKLEINLGWGLTFDLKRHLNGQPLQLMAKNKATGQHLWNFEYWHRGLLEDARRAMDN